MSTFDSVSASKNADARTVEGFGDEWSRFDFEAQDPRILDEAFENYFSIFPWESLPGGAVGFDAGCGSGRWAERVAPRVGHLHCVDASAAALSVARRKLSRFSNCTVHETVIEEMPIKNASMDFGFSLGVLHHTPDPKRSLATCVAKLKPGAPFLLYLYYSLDNCGPAYRALWKASDLARRGISRMPRRLRIAICEIIAAGVYWPLARSARLAEAASMKVEKWPLTFYRNSDFYIMRNDALDRFGTAVEHRFSKDEIERMMNDVGLEHIVFSNRMPFWVAVGVKR